ncbi:hypothetical protein ACFQVD_44470 [Streptosporangium amethystogenes subsp. fukuiense]|uniref:Uncharacterized protein n=1 Tax=Streptosporangium amethystogenes subsp. fukuiense TaxID=698418 RepID=A0ABW2TF22_9ACTN
MNAAEITRVTLHSGLRIVIEEEYSGPVAGVAVHYDIGFRAEAENASGPAHLFDGPARRPGAHARALRAVVR